MTEPNLVARATQGDTIAITSLLNLTLQSQDITAKVQIKNRCLHILLESPQTPDQQSAIFLIQKTINNIQITSIESIKVYGRQIGKSHADWTEILPLPAIETQNIVQKTPNLRQLAKQGDVDAIRLLINRAIEHKNIMALINLQDNCLDIILESIDIPNETIATTLIFRELKTWKTNLISTVKIQAKKSGDNFFSWNQELDLISGYDLPKLSPQYPSKVTKISQPKKTKFPIKIDFKNLDHFQAGLIILIAIYGIFGSLNPGLDGPFMWLHFPDLAIHETGHLIFMILFGSGSFMHILGGSLTQILFPAAFTIYFFLYGQRYSSAITLFWTAQNFMDVSVYIKDAQARELPLTVDDPDAHDWYNLLSWMNILEYDQQIGNFVYFIGFLIFIASILLGIYFSQLPEKFKRN
ncbi:hypothetical protein [Anabaena azotica]|uniref:hypothetical protein n=1 Tax=Anabaena azotica TaxID=197653 RepID=UPI0039A6D8A9